ncbi:hypothetical protein TEA_029575 [Camellia sinensis var. sinensis]|uniref:Cytochrome b5 heme-binding domain-containing protein n=1 Tax=Camellia sinensis var. sinensis TaxID=542762 RepID=A0A4V6RYA1_CAMSN|nr:hypothetical protein TEA_029575 [Camellia sinensis var. sinensis]
MNENYFAKITKLYVDGYVHGGDGCDHGVHGAVSGGVLHNPGGDGGGLQGVCGMFVAVEDYTAVKKANAYALREPVQLGDVTEEELRAYDGSDPEKPLLMAIKDRSYDVSRSRVYEKLELYRVPFAVTLHCNGGILCMMFYGPGGPYALFAGRDASRALALMSFDRQDLTGNIEGLSASELEVLQDWEYKFMEKYVKVGQLVSERKLTEPTENGDKMPQNAEENGAQQPLTSD